MILIQEISKLSVAERILMIEKIWDSINPENLDLNDSHKMELDKRLERYKSGETKFYTWEKVKKDIDQSKE